MDGHKVSSGSNLTQDSLNKRSYILQRANQFADILTKKYSQNPASSALSSSNATQSDLEIVDSQPSTPKMRLSPTDRIGSTPSEFFTPSSNLKEVAGFKSDGNANISTAVDKSPSVNSAQSTPNNNTNPTGVKTGIPGTPITPTGPPSSSSSITPAPKKINREDFESLAIIGRGAFGEVRLVRTKDTNDRQIYGKLPFLPLSGYLSH